MLRNPLVSIPITAVVVMFAAFAIFWFAANPLAGSTPDIGLSRPAASAPSANQFETSQIKLQSPNFQGRSAPSAAFPLSDDYYAELGKTAFQNPQMRGYGSLLEYFGDVKKLSVTPIKMQELGFSSLQDASTLKIQYLVSANGQHQNYVVYIRRNDSGTWISGIMNERL